MKTRDPRFLDNIVYPLELRNSTGKRRRRSGIFAEATEKNHATGAYSCENVQYILIKYDKTILICDEIVFVTLVII